MIQQPVFNEEESSSASSEASANPTAQQRTSKATAARLIAQKQFREALEAATVRAQSDFVGLYSTMTLLLSNHWLCEILTQIAYLMT